MAKARRDLRKRLKLRRSGKLGKRSYQGAGERNGKNHSEKDGGKRCRGSKALKRGDEKGQTNVWSGGKGGCT